MEDGEEDLQSIFSYLPPLLQQRSSLFWPSQVVEALKSLSNGPDHITVNSGDVLFLAISDIRRSLSLFEPLAPSAADGYSLFFDDLLSAAESSKWFGEVLPSMANLVLQLPSLLEAHYREANGGFNTRLRLLDSQESGIVFLSQELIGALLVCSFFCLFPVTDRGAKRLPTINFDNLFASMYHSYSEAQENKIKCITHYFERICSIMPGGVVSFERKVLPLEHIPPAICYPSAELWSKSCIPLCRFEIYKSGLIEDQSSEALEVDFANKYLGGGALNRGCVQEEIRFMISPELIIGMLFLPAMADNEAIEIVGSERFSNYRGYASTFRFAEDNIDNRDSDIMRRRKTRIIAIDALCSPGKRQFGSKCLLREVNKAFCGFLDHSEISNPCQRLDLEDKSSYSQVDRGDKPAAEVSTDSHVICEAPTSSSNNRYSGEQLTENSKEKNSDYSENQKDKIGIATGNWGCGAFGGDPELKAILQWIAASQAQRPFISYYTFGLEALRSLDQVTQWVLSHEWTVGELWDVLLEYSSQKLKGETDLGFFSWLIPSISSTSVPMILD